VVRIEFPRGHLSDLTPSMLATAGVPQHVKVLDLKRRLKCRACKWKGGGGIGEVGATRFGLSATQSGA